MALMVAALLAVSWRMSRAWQGIDLFTDDAYYYTVIARNFVETGRFTFDGLSETNGFHPLLFWLETGGFALFGTQSCPMSQYRCLLAGFAAVFLLTIGGCLAAAHRRAQTDEDTVIQSALLLIACVVLVPHQTAIYLGGMESILVLPLLLLSGVLAWKQRYAAAGLAALMLVMSRLDTLPFVVFPMATACAWRERHQSRHAIVTGLKVAVPAIVGLLILMAFHRYRFGHPMPISGALKSCFPGVHFQWHQVFARPFGGSYRLTLPMAFVVSVMSAGLLLPGGKLSNGVRGVGLTAALLCLIQLAAFMLFQKWSKPIPVWYFGPSVLLATTAFAVAVANRLGPVRLQRLAAAAAVAVLAINLLSQGRAWHRGIPPWPTSSRPVMEVAGSMRELIDFMDRQPSDAVWACTDCGKLAFFSGRTVVNLDGLVNDFHFQDMLGQQRLAEYLVQRDVDFLFFLAWDRPQVASRRYEPMYDCRVAPDVISGDYRQAEFYVYSYRHMVHSDTVRLPSTAEVWRSSPARDGNVLGGAVIFDIEKARRGWGVARGPRDAVRLRK